MPRTGRTQMGLADQSHLTPLDAAMEASEHPDRSNIRGLVLEGYRHRLPGGSREDITLPIPVVTESDPEHSPVAIVFGRVIYDIRRPSHPKARVRALANQEKMRFMPRFPRQVALRPANYQRARATVGTLVDATLTRHVRRLRHAGPRKRQRQNNQNWNHPQSPSPHSRNRFYLHGIMIFSVRIENTQFYWLAFFIPLGAYIWRYPKKIGAQTLDRHARDEICQLR